MFINSDKTDRELAVSLHQAQVPEHQDCHLHLGLQVGRGKLSYHYCARQEGSGPDGLPKGVEEV